MTDPKSHAFIWRQLGDRLVHMPVVRQLTGWRPPPPEPDSGPSVDRFPSPDMPGTKKRRKGLRTPGEVDTICFHQTAIEFGTSRRQRKKWGSHDQARVARFARTPYHVVVTTDGHVIWANPLNVYTFHGDRSNSRSIGVAFEGLFPARFGERQDRHTELTARMVIAGQTAVAEIIRVWPYVDHVTAHRCWDGSREGDPGHEIWRRVVAPACQLHGLTVLDEIDEANGGKPIPEGWMA